MREADLNAFWARVDRSGECWLWTGLRKESGYGVLYVREDGQKRKVRAHRMAYEMAVGRIGDGLCVCHRCDTPACVRPEHLFLGTQGENQRDKKAKGRASRWRSELTHCKRGHAFTPENTMHRRTGVGRECRTCRRAYVNRVNRERREMARAG